MHKNSHAREGVVDNAGNYFSISHVGNLYSLENYV
jgi:hypothetical protein